jgi:hypothetical protein
MVRISISVAILLLGGVGIWTEVAASSAYLGGSKLSVSILCPTAPMSDPAFSFTLTNLGSSPVEVSRQFPISIMLHLIVKDSDGHIVQPNYDFDSGTRSLTQPRTLEPGKSLTLEDWILHDQPQTQIIPLRAFGYKLAAGTYALSATATDSPNEPPSNTCKVVVAPSSNSPSSAVPRPGEVLFKAIPAASIPNNRIDAHIPPNTDPVDRKIVREVMAALPPTMRQFIVWFHVPAGKPGYEELPNHGLMVQYYDSPDSRVNSVKDLPGLYVLYFDGKVQLDANIIYESGLDHYLVVVPHAFSWYFLNGEGQPTPLPSASSEPLAIPVATFTAAKKVYLDTESPTGSLTIDNRSDSEVSFYSTSITFRIRDAAGNVREDRWIKTVSLWRPWVILPGKQQTLNVPLPKCEVISNPCAEHVSIRLSVTPKGGKDLVITTNEQSYTFTPAPTATQ